MAITTLIIDESNKIMFYSLSEKSFINKIWKFNLPFKNSIVEYKMSKNICGGIFLKNIWYNLGHTEQDFKILLWNTLINKYFRKLIKLENYHLKN